MSLPAVRVGNSCSEKRREPPAQTVPLRLRLSCVQGSGSPVEMAVAVCRVGHCKQTSLLHMNDPQSRMVAGQLLCALSLLLAWGYTQILVDQLTQPVPVTPHTTPMQNLHRLHDAPVQRALVRNAQLGLV